MKYNLFKQTY